jgi:hypothetical protein
MRSLVRPWHNADLSDHPIFVDLTGSAIGPGPFGDRPAPDALLIGKRDFGVFAVVLPGVLGPGFLDDLEGLLVDAPVVVVDLRAVDRRPGGVVLLA